jgi:hypothetical protein
VHTWCGGTGGFRISLPFEELSERKMLDDWKLAQHFGIVHLQHALVDLSPAVFDARNVEQYRRVFPEWSLLDIEDELDSTIIHVA